MEKVETQEIGKYVSGLLDEGNEGEIIKTLSTYHPSEIASIIQSLEPEEHAKLLHILDIETASEVILELEQERREEILTELDQEKIADILEEMDSDDAADLIGEMPEYTARTVLARMDPGEVREVEPLLQYPEDSAGGIMQTELVQIDQDSTVKDAINWIRLIANDVENFHRIYVTEDRERLVGNVSLTKLILANPRTRIKNIMEPVEVTITPMMDQEEVANIFKKYDVVSLPVVDERGNLLGRVTSDDIMDVMTEEASEDMYQLAGVGDYLHPIYTSTKTRIKLRTPWMLLTLFGELLIAFIIVYAFQPTLEKIAILAAFMPAIMAIGGNVGIQTTTIVIRGIGMGTIEVGQIFKIIFSEIKVGLSIGVICGIVAAAFGALISTNEPYVSQLAVAVFIAMVSATIATSFVGVAAPLLLYKLDFDPAASSGPFLTMFNDLFGSVVYLFIAMLIF